MKTNLLFLVIVLLVKFGFTQEYFPLVEEDKTWYVLETGFPNYDQSFIYKCEGDTLIGNEIYKVLFFTTPQFPESWMKIGYILEDETHKVYFSIFKPNDPGYFEQALLYDFNAGINDSLTITSILYFDEPTEIDIVITEIDSVLAGGEFRKRTWFECGYGDNYWIEGIGSNSGLLQLGFYCLIETIACDLQCVKKQGTTIYPDGYTGSCYFVGIDKNSHKESTFDIFPNPARNYFMVMPTLHLRSNPLFELYNTLGEIVDQLYLNNNQPTQITTDRLKSGLYYYIISNEKSVVQKGKVIIKK